MRARGLVGVDGLVGGDGVGGEAGADDVDAVEPGLGGDAGFVAGPGEVVVGDGDGEVLLDLAAVGLAPEAVADPVPSAQLRAGPADDAGDLLEGGLGGAEQVLALARALVAQARVEADHEALAGEGGAADLGDRVFQQLVRPQRRRPVGAGRAQQRAEVRGLERRDPVEPGRFHGLVDARGGQHAAVADQGDPLDTEAGPDLVRHGGGVGGVAGEHLDRHRAAVARAEQAEDDLLAALLAIAVVAEGGQRAAPPLDEAGRRVVQHQGAVPEVPVGQALLDPGLARQQPVEHRQHLVAGDRAEGGGGGLRRELPGGRELGIRRQHPGHDGGQREIALAAAEPVQDAGQPQLAAGAEHRADMTMRQAAPHGERLVRACEGDAPLDHPADTPDQPGRQVGEVGEGLPADALAFAPGLAEQDREPAAAVRDGFDVVGHGRRPCMETGLPALWRTCRQGTTPVCPAIPWKQISTKKPGSTSTSRNVISTLARLSLIYPQ